MRSFHSPKIVRVMHRMTVLSLVLVTCFAAGLAGKEVPREFDPTGTWRWIAEFNGFSFESKLRLRMAVDLNGQRTDRQKILGEMEIGDQRLIVDDGRIEGDQIVLVIILEKFKLELIGRIEGDSIQGTAQYHSSKTEKHAWHARRGLELVDYAGIWKVRIESPDGSVFEPVISIVSHQAADVQGFYRIGQHGEFEFDSVDVQDSWLVCSLETEIGHRDFRLVYRGRLRGGILEGTLQCDVAGHGNVVDFTASRQR